MKIEEIQKGKQLAVPTSPDVTNAFANVQSFELAQRIGGMFSRSLLVPATFRGPDGLPDCIIAYNMANRIGCDPLMVMQNLYVVHGKPAWSGQFVIAAINQSGLFAEPLHFQFVGTEGKDDWGCYALAVTKSGREIKGPTVTIGMAKAEGWHGKNPKWRNMPELMLRYRAGAFFGKTECPELLMGFKTAEEVQDIIEINPDTGEVLNRDGFASPSSLGGAEVEADECDTVPWGAGSPEQEESARQLTEQGFYTEAGEDGPIYFNIKGDIWNPDVHATSTETGGPIINKSDGSFRARRTVAATQPADDMDAESTPNFAYGLD